MESITPEALEFIREKIDEIIKNSSDIDEREERIIRLRFGLEDKGPVKIRDLAKIFKVPPRKMKEEVDLVEKKIFNKLKKNI
ncbi:MAG: hypothetical protein PWQ37_2913 [Candidatus Petromonas sp.]|jgi:RNA polymerase primary sigma factor|nr:hypothetical protein [Candidatus Petromonas sp.]